MGDSKKLQNRGLTLVPAGLQQGVGPDGNTYITPLFHLRDANGDIQCLNTEQGPIPFTIVGAPVNVSRIPGMVLPPSAGGLIIGR